MIFTSISDTASVMLKPPMNYILTALGFIFVALGILGIILPLIPGVPFLILAALCFSKSSPKLHHWLISLPHIGPMLKDWERHGVIELQAKIAATIMIFVLISYPLIWGPISQTIKIVIASIILCVLVFIWTRPSVRIK